MERRRLALVRGMGPPHRPARRRSRVLRRGHRAHAGERVRGRGPLRHRTRQTRRGRPRARPGEVRRRARHVHARRGRGRDETEAVLIPIPVVVDGRHVRAAVATVRARIVRARLRRGLRRGRRRGGGRRRPRRPGRRQGAIAPGRAPREDDGRSGGPPQARSLSRVRRARLRIPRGDASVEQC